MYVLFKLPVFYLAFKYVTKLYLENKYKDFMSQNLHFDI